MAGTKKHPVVVAELGRPETPEETAARKARDSRLYRQRKTVNNLVFSLLVSLGLVIVIVLVVPRGTDTWSGYSIDPISAAEQNAASAGRQLMAPETPEGWLAKQAELRYSTSGDIAYWYIGYTTGVDTSQQGYVALVQAFTENGTTVDEAWIAEQLESQSATGVERIAGYDWTVYDHEDRSGDQGNLRFGLQTEINGAAVLVYGTADAATIRSFAAQVVADAALRGDVSDDTGSDTETEAETETNGTGTETEGNAGTGTTGTDATDTSTTEHSASDAGAAS